VSEAERGLSSVTAIGLRGGTIQALDLRDLPRLVDAEHQRPLEQWWLGLRPMARILAQSGPKPNMRSEL
jgi:6-phosphofructokinase 1